MEAEPVLDFVSARADAQQAQFSTSDYGSVGDQRPYQVVQPAYAAPQFLQTFQKMQDALRECDTLCRLTGKPYRLVKWGARIPCVPCGQKIRDNRLPGLKVRYSRGALQGYPEATPIAEVRPQGTFVYGPQGEETLVGAPNYRIASKPFPRSEFYNPEAPSQRYIEAVKSAQYIADRAGRRTFVCSSFGAPCTGRGPNWVPVVYADPGGLVARYPYELELGKGAIAGNTNVVTGVTPSEYRELIVQSEGSTLLPNGA